jgi:hypothetical protein
MVSLGQMRGIPLTLRALVLVPLLAAGVDLTRATVVCGARAETCLEAAGRGWLGPAGAVLAILYALGLALWVARLARGGATTARAGSSLARAWLTGTVGVAAACAGQALLAGALDGSAPLGGGWAATFALCVAAGGVVALALRVAPAAGALVRELRPSAPLALAPAALSPAFPLLPARAIGAPRTAATAGRAPPGS